MFKDSKLELIPETEGTNIFFLSKGTCPYRLNILKKYILMFPYAPIDPNVVQIPI